MKKFTKLLKDKKLRWTTGGIMCLALAAGMFALGSNVGAEAVTLGNQEITLELNNGVYEIDSYSELKALGSASSGETTGKTFELVSDLIVNEEITAAAIGTFSGNFNGNGHLITFNNIDISDDTSAANNQPGGLLFGTVDGTVQNVLVEIVDNDAEVDLEKSSNGTVQQKGEKIYSYTESSHKTNQSEIAAITTVETIDGKEYKVETVTESGTETTEYEAVGSETNSFGFICGELESKGILKQIGLFGTDNNAMNVSAINDVLLGYSKSVQSGSRTVIYKYEIKESTAEKKLDTSENAGVSVSTTLYDGRETIVEEGSEDNLLLKVSAPKAVPKTDEKITYTIQLIKDESFTENNLTIVDDKGTIIATSEQISFIENSAKLQYEYEFENAENVSKAFTVKSNVPEEQGLFEISTEPISTVVCDASGSTSTETFGSDLYQVDAMLSVDKKAVIGSGTFGYTLTLKNSHTTENFNLTNALDGWSVKETGTTTKGFVVGSNQMIQPRETVVLYKEGTVAETVSFVPSGKWSSVAVSYEYDSLKTERTGFVALDEESSKEGTPITLSGSLFVGGIAGSSTGTIQEIKQTLNITSETATAVGGIAGSATAGSLSDLYMLGKVNGESIYTGNGTVSIVGSADTEQTSAPSNGNCWTTYNEYTQSGDVISRVVHAELNWLVKPVQFSYGDPTTDNKIKVTLGDSNKITSADLDDIAIGYSARKDLSVTENQSYYSDEGVIDLGQSGFYKVLAAYTSDGYYHYYEDSNSEDIKYPYTNEGPFSIVDGQVVRSKFNPLEDVLKLTLSPNVSSGGKVYYVVNAATSLPGMGTNPKSTSLNSQGIAIIPFQEESAQYRLVAVVNDHIYPAFISTTYGVGMKEVLPKPDVKVFNYYNSNGEKNEYVDFGSSEASYIAEEGLKIQPYSINENTNYSFRYMFSEDAPESGKWDFENEKEYYKNRYLGDKKTFFTDLKKPIDYTDSSIIPKDFAGKKDVYLYVEISKKNYSSEIYCYGPIDISSRDVLTPVLPSNNGYTVINGDIMKISGAPKDASVEYCVSKTPLSSYPNTWLTYSSSNGILMNENVGNYVYARIKHDNSKYSGLFEFACAFGGRCADPSVTPNTGIPTGNLEDDKSKAAVINSTTAIRVSSRTENANIFYCVSDVKSTIMLERVDSVPSEVENDGDCNTAQTQKYFKVGERWYRTDNVNVERYTTSLYLVNDTSEPVLKYISAIAVADGYEISEARNYVYSIKQAQRVERPEAAIETSFSPSEEKHEVASVALGANITFYSVTPEVEIFYAIGTGTEEPTIPIPADGIVVEGNYGENFVVRVQAKRAGMLPSEIITFLYKISDQELVSTPTATPGTSDDLPTEILPGNKILLSTTTKEAAIYYTLDGSSPVVNVDEYGVFSSGNDATFLYDPTEGIDMPGMGKDYFTITAVAVKKEFAQSKEAHFTYKYPANVLAPYANFASGKVELNATVLLKNLTDGALIYYNVAYGETVPEDPTLTSSVFNEAYPFAITQKTTIKAMAVKNNVKSEIATFTFEPMEQLSVPTASIQSGSVVSIGIVLELKAGKDATIYYTMDGSDPMDADNKAIMTGNSLVLNGETGGQITIKAYAVAPNKSKSEVVTFTYLFSANSGGVTASIESGSTVSDGTKVNLISDVTEGDIYYTKDGSSPVSYGKKGTTVEIKGTPGSTFTLKAVVIVNGEPGTIATFIYKIQDCPDAPTASPAGGVLAVATRVTLSAGTETIYYTTDGTDPTKSSALYSEPILINRATILKAIAVSEDGVISDVSTFVYEAALKAASVKSSKADGEILEPGDQIHLTTATEDAVIYYSTDGTEPSLDNLDSMLVYDGNFIEINRSVTINAVAYRKDLRLSDIQTWSYLVEKIPAVEQKEAEAAKLAEEGLKDTDPSALVRENGENADKGTKTIRERNYMTAVLYSDEAFDGNVVLETIKEEDNPYTIKKAKGIYGNDATVLVSYKVKVKIGSFGVQPRETVEVALPIPNGYEDAVLSVALVKDDYNLQTLETRRESDIFYVKIDKVGSYVIIGPERTNVEQHQFPYLIVLEAAAGAVLAGGAIFCLKEKVKKIKKNK